MNRPCPTTILCDDANPFANLSSEGPEPFWIPPQVAYWTRTGYCCDKTTLTVFSMRSGDDAEELLERTMATTCPKCDEPKKFCATADCPDGTRIAEVCVPSSYEDALAEADKAKALGLPFCPALPFSATCSCPDGTNVHTVQSAESDRVAQAQCAAIPKHCDPPCNAPQTCIVTCPDGTFFSYTVPACAIVAETVDIANAQAYSLACARAHEQRICLQPIDACACVNSAYFATIQAVGPGNTSVTWSLDGGTLPPGVHLVIGQTGTGTTSLGGIPTTAGTYTFSVRATNSQGGSAVKTYSIYVLEITTASLPDYTVGVPYSQQLTAIGGSGSYVWRIVLGTLPDGLSFSSSGILSGTPTAATGTLSILFEVSDVVCDGLNRSFRTPRVALKTTSTTHVRIKRGYPEYVLSTGALYKRITWSGQITQTAMGQPAQNGILLTDPFTGLPLPQAQCAGARFTYSGYSEIDASGNFTVHHSKVRTTETQIYAPAAAIGGWPPTAEGINARLILSGAWTGPDPSRIHHLPGFCWAYDPNSAQTCPTNPSSWVNNGNFAIDAAYDAPIDMLTNPAGFTRSALTLSYSGTATGDFTLLSGGLFNQLAHVTATGSFGAVLSNPYTDAEALATQQTYTGKLDVAENKPDYLRAAGQQWLTFLYSRYTTVDFRLECADLIVGEQYTVRYDLVDTTSGTVTSQTSTFTASATTQVITGQVPNPASGHSTQIRHATIVFV